MIVALITAVHILVCFSSSLSSCCKRKKRRHLCGLWRTRQPDRFRPPRRGQRSIKSHDLVGNRFMVTSITLSIYASRRTASPSVLQGIKSAPVKTQPAPPAQKHRRRRQLHPPKSRALLDYLDLKLAALSGREHAVSSLPSTKFSRIVFPEIGC